MEEERERWNKRYAGESLLHGEAPSEFLARCMPCILALVPGRKALDLACGEGRNSLFLAREGFSVTGVDISAIALAKGCRRSVQEGLDIEWVESDLDEYAISANYHLIININFLQRELLLKCVEALSSGGLLLVDTILAAPNAPVPHNPLYLLRPGELCRIFQEQPGVILQLEERPDDDLPTAKMLFRKHL